MDSDFLRTRSLNQDPIENFFAFIRSLHAAKTNPNCFQFISAFQTTVLNNLITPHSRSTNCEKDDSSILDNLQSFLTLDDEFDSSFVPLNSRWY